jgi:hypothetical protein
LCEPPGVQCEIVVRDNSLEIGNETSNRAPRPPPCALKRQHRRDATFVLDHGDKNVVSNTRNSSGKLGTEVWTGELRVSTLRCRPPLPNVIVELPGWYDSDLHRIATTNIYEVEVVFGIVSVVGTFYFPRSILRLFDAV